MTPHSFYNKNNILSFNPCFGGSYIVTMHIVDRSQCQVQFQSLFWWILYCDDYQDLKADKKIMFQSLFWWILYCDT